MNSLSKYYQVSRQMHMDPRFKNIEDKDREDIFQDFLDDLEKQEKEDRRDQRYHFQNR